MGTYNSFDSSIAGYRPRKPLFRPGRQAFFHKCERALLPFVTAHRGTKIIRRTIEQLFEFYLADIQHQLFGGGIGIGRAAP